MLSNALRARGAICCSVFFNIFDLKHALRFNLASFVLLNIYLIKTGYSHHARARVSVCARFILCATDDVRRLAALGSRLCGIENCNCLPLTHELAYSQYTISRSIRTIMN